MKAVLSMILSISAGFFYCRQNIHGLTMTNHYRLPLHQQDQKNKELHGVRDRNVLSSQQKTPHGPTWITGHIFIIHVINK